MNKILHMDTEGTNARGGIRARIPKHLAYVLLAAFVLIIPLRAQAASILELNPGDIRSGIVTDTVIRATHSTWNLRTGEYMNGPAGAGAGNPAPNVVTAYAYAGTCMPPGSGTPFVCLPIGRYAAQAVGIIGKSFRVAAGATPGQTIPVTVRFAVDRVGGLIAMGPAATANLKISVSVLDLDTGRSAMYESIEDAHEGSLLGSWNLIYVVPVPLPTGGTAANKEFRVSNLSLVRGHMYQIRLQVTTSATGSYIGTGAAATVSPIPVGRVGEFTPINPAGYQVRLKDVEIEVAQEGQQGVGELLLIIDQLRNEISQLQDHQSAMEDEIASLRSGQSDLLGENQQRIGEITDLNLRLLFLQSRVDRLLKKKHEKEPENEKEEHRGPRR